MSQKLSDKALSIIRRMQQNELTESVIYEKIAAFAKGEENKQTLLRLSKEEYAHYQIWKKYTGVELKPEKAKVLKYTWIARILGFTFAVKLMERGEEGAQEEYGLLTQRWRRARPSASRRKSTKLLCWRCWMKSVCSTWAPWCWASMTLWWS